MTQAAASASIRINGEDEPLVAATLAALLDEKAVDVSLDIWPGWSHDWPYWMEMMRRYV